MLRRLLPSKIAENIYFAACGLVVLGGFALIFLVHPPQLGGLVGVAGFSAAAWVRWRLWAYDWAGTARPAPGVGTRESPQRGTATYVSVTRPAARRRGSGGVYLVSLDGQMAGWLYPGGTLTVEVLPGDHQVRVTQRASGIGRRCDSGPRSIFVHPRRALDLHADRAGSALRAYLTALRRGSAITIHE